MARRRGINPYVQGGCCGCLAALPLIPIILIWQFIRAVLESKPIKRYHY